MLTIKHCMNFSCPYHASFYVYSFYVENDILDIQKVYSMEYFLLSTY